jgi:pyridoxal phosphate enzyme (YggS family)
MYHSIQEYLINKKVTLVAVSKTHPDSAILDLYQKNQRIFGENKVQELVGKYDRLPKDINWHFIGHLQRNKVKYIAPFIDTIHSIDSLRLLKEISKQALKNNRVIKCLIQIKIAQEEEKYGIAPPDLSNFFEEITKENLTGISIVGLMGMATYTDNTVQIKKEFKLLQKIFNEVKTSYFSVAEDFRELSMGMSEDYQLAVECGSTMVRIGSLIFGKRDYQ